MFLLLCSTSAFAQSDYSPTWSVSGIENAESMTLDIDIGTSFISIHGGIFFSTGSFTPLQGTCLLTNTNGMICGLDLYPVGRMSISIESDLSGIWQTINQANAVLEEGALTFVSLNPQ